MTKIKLPPDQPATAKDIMDALDHATRHHPRHDITNDDVLWRYLERDDRVTLSNCQKSAVRLTNVDGAFPDLLVFPRCRSLWCRGCAQHYHLQNMTYHARRILSLTAPLARERAAAGESSAPTASDLEAIIQRNAEEPWRRLSRAETDLVRLGHLVFTLPDPLAQLAVTDARIIAASRAAIMDTIVRAYGHRDAKARDTLHGRSAFAALITTHPFGDEREPFPQPRVHFDVLLVGARMKKNKDGTRTLRALPPRWQPRYDITRWTFRESLRRELLRHNPTLETLQAARELPEKLSLHIEEYDDRNFMVTGRKAMHAIWYSLRPHVWPAGFAFTGEHDEQGRDLVAYRGLGKGALLHVQPGDEMFQRFHAMLDVLSPSENAAGMGAFAKNTYANVCTAINVRKVDREKRQTGYHPTASIERLPDNTWPPITPAPGPGAVDVARERYRRRARVAEGE